MAITGITITLMSKEQTGTDPLGMPVYSTTPVTIDNVLVAPASATDIIDSTDLEGGKVIYTLALPKGDTHDFNDVEVQFFGYTWKTYGMPQEGIEDNIPLSWNKKIMVERVD